MDPTPSEQHEQVPPKSPFSSSSRKIKPVSRFPEQNLRSSRRVATFPPVKGSNSDSDLSRVDTHLQAKAMTVSVDSAPFKRKPVRALLKGLHLESVPKPCSPTAGDIKEMSETGSSWRSKDRKVLDEKRCEGGEKRLTGDIKEMSETGLSGHCTTQKVVDEKICEGGEKRLVLVGDRRRSFCGTDVEVGRLFACVGARILAKDMPPFMQIHAVTCARKAYDGLEKFSSKALAFTLKKEFDKVYGPAWHCIVGSSFGSFVTHSVGGFLYFSLEKMHILVFKTAVQRAD